VDSPRSGLGADLFLEYQRGWKNNQIVPAYIREQMKIDAEPTRDLRDNRVRAAFAMAPGDIKAFGMDEAGLRQMAIPTYLIVGAGDTTTPPDENAAFAAKYIPHAQLDVLPGPVGHEIFDNECDRIGRDNYPEGSMMLQAWIGSNCTSTSEMRRCSFSIRISVCGARNRIDARPRSCGVSCRASFVRRRLFRVVPHDGIDDAHEVVELVRLGRRLRVRLQRDHKVVLFEPHVERPVAERLALVEPVRAKRSENGPAKTE